MKTSHLTRRRFLNTTTPLIVGGLTGFPLHNLGVEGVFQVDDPTVQDVIDKIMSQIPGDRRPNSVDTIKTGNGNAKVTGIATTFLATVDVIQRAIDQNCNFIITHEPTFYNHFDETEWLANDPVYQAKRKLIEENNIVIWRFHDYWHQHRPDGILTGFLRTAGWQDLQNPKIENSCIIPETSLQSLAKEIKEKFQLDRCFYVGDGDLVCSKVGVLPGSWGREPHIELLQNDIDVLVIGEAAEWETVEYVRDAASSGMKKGLIIMGHAMSEEPGMAYLQSWLSKLFPNLKISHIPARDPFTKVE